MKLLPALLVVTLALPAPAAEVAPQPTTLDCDHAELWSVGAKQQ